MNVGYLVKKRCASWDVADHVWIFQLDAPARSEDYKIIAWQELKCLESFDS